MFAINLDKENQQMKKAQGKAVRNTEDDAPESGEEDPPPNQHKYGTSSVSQTRL